MKQYYIDKHVTYCYPYETKKLTKEYGVLSKYIGKYFSRDEIDEIICELVMKHPYIENSMMLNLAVMWRDERIVGYYHTLDFRNDNYEKQNRGSLEIKYEK